MSIIDSKEVSLSYLINESNLIVEAEFIQHYVEEIPVIDSWGASPGKSIRPFMKKGYIFKITGILKNDGNIPVPETIRVPVENWRRSLSQHKEAYGGVSKSFTVNEYSTGVADIKKASILFLYRFKDTFELKARDAFEDRSAKERIKALLRSRH